MYLYFINVLTLIKICHSSIGAGSDKTTVGHNPTIVRELIFWYLIIMVANNYRTPETTEGGAFLNMVYLTTRYYG